jgi:hypothetical protein
VGNTEEIFFFDIRETVNISEMIFLVCCKHKIKAVGRDIAVGIATHYGLDGLGMESRWGRDFLHPSRPPWGPPSLLCNGYWVFSGDKRSGRGVDHPPHLAPKLKKEYILPLIPLWVFVACSNVTFTFILP